MHCVCRVRCDDARNRRHLCVFQKNVWRLCGLLIWMGCLLGHQYGGSSRYCFCVCPVCRLFLHLPRFSEATEQSVVWHLPFVGDLFPLANFGVKSLAITLVAGLTWLNYRSVKAGSSFQLISTIVKMAVIAALVVGIFFLVTGRCKIFSRQKILNTGVHC